MGFEMRNYIIVLLVLFLAAAAAAAADPAGAVMTDSAGAVTTANTYNGSFSMQWHAVEEEWALDSETSRRILQSNPNYITYKVTQSPLPAGAARSGLSYSRNCKQIYGCRGGGY